MATATAERPRRRARGKKAEGLLEQARVAKLRHAHFLARLIFEHLVKTGVRRGHGWEILQDFQRAAILSTALNLGLRRPDGAVIASRSQLTAVQLGQICTALRQQMKERKIPIPRAGRRKSGGSQESGCRHQTLGELLQVILDKAGQLGWPQQTLDSFIERQCHGELRTVAHAQAVLGGLNGILRHQEAEKQ